MQDLAPFDLGPSPRRPDLTNPLARPGAPPNDLKDPLVPPPQQ
jgi:hypothetical protein